MEFKADMRYLDQIYEVTVPIPDLNFNDQKLREKWAHNFHIRFEELYSYRQSEQEIRLVTLRTTILAPIPKISNTKKITNHLAIMNFQNHQKGKSI